MFNLPNAAQAARIIELEAALAEAHKALTAALMIQRERAVLISAVRNNRYITLIFARNGQLTTAEFYATTDVDVNTLRRELLEPLK